MTCCQIAGDGSCVVIGTPKSHDVIKLYPPTNQNEADQNIVYGDASRKGQTFDLSGEV